MCKYKKKVTNNLLLLSLFLNKLKDKNRGKKERNTTYSSLF